MSFDTRNALKIATRLLANSAIEKARGGALLQQQFPTHYMPEVGRQVMAEGGDADPIVGQAQGVLAQQSPQMPVQKAAKAPKAPKEYKFDSDEDLAKSVQDENLHRGLQFPIEEGIARVKSKLNRERAAASGKAVAGNPVNPRTVIKAPKGSNLPDFVAGNLTFDDWMKRHEKILSPEEIHSASKWYKNVYNTFKQYYPDDEEAKRNMRAWLVAQQNVSPAGAMQNVLLQKEQMARNVPKELWKAGGMPNPTEAARSVLQDQPISGGVGQKIADFVDSAEGKDVRSWMANHPDGESPFVIDVHSARDTGMVDPELINHLTRLGYDPNELNKLQIDLKGTPTEAAYENRAKFGRELTKHLNKIGWMGRKDWRPEEIQAVGWMGMTKLTRNAEEDAESGLSRNLRRVSYEVDPGEGSPWAERHGEDFGNLTPDEKAELTSHMTAKALDHASKVAGINVHSLVHGTGAWEQYQNPAAVAQSLSTQKGADIAANTLGYLLNQTEVWHNRTKPMTSSPKGFAIDFVEHGTKNLADKEYLKDFWQKIMDADTSGLFRGFQPITLPTGEVGIRALVDKGGVGTQKKIEEAIAENGPIHRALSEMGPEFGLMGHEAEITKHRNDWKDQKNGEGYLARLVELAGPDTAKRVAGLRGEIDEALKTHLKEIKARRSQIAPRQERWSGGKVNGYAEGGSPTHEPHRRAEEQGYSLRGFHVTRGDRAERISSAKRFDPYLAQSPGEEAVFFWDHPDAANQWIHAASGIETFDPEKMSQRDIDKAERHASSVMPVRIHPGKTSTIDWTEATGRSDYDNNWMKKILGIARNMGYDTLRIKNMREYKMPKTYDQIAVLNPAVIRSEYAKYDPEDKGRDDIGAARGGSIEDRQHLGFGGEGEGPERGSTGSAAGNSYASSGSGRSGGIGSDSVASSSGSSWSGGGGGGGRDSSSSNIGGGGGGLRNYTGGADIAGGSFGGGSSSTYSLPSLAAPTNVAAEANSPQQEDQGILSSFGIGQNIGGDYLSKLMSGDLNVGQSLMNFGDSAQAAISNAYNQATSSDLAQAAKEKMLGASDSLNAALAEANQAITNYDYQSAMDRAVGVAQDVLNSGYGLYNSMTGQTVPPSSMYGENNWVGESDKIPPSLANVTTIEKSYPQSESIPTPSEFSQPASGDVLSEMRKTNPYALTEMDTSGLTPQQVVDKINKSGIYNENTMDVLNRAFDETMPKSEWNEQQPQNEGIIDPSIRAHFDRLLSQPKAEPQQAGIEDPSIQARSQMQPSVYQEQGAEDPSTSAWRPAQEQIVEQLPSLDQYRVAKMFTYDPQAAIKDLRNQIAEKITFGSFANDPSSSYYIPDEALQKQIMESNLLKGSLISGGNETVLTSNPALMKAIKEGYAFKPEGRSEELQLSPSQWMSQIDVPMPPENRPYSFEPSYAEYDYRGRKEGGRVVGSKNVGDLKIDIETPKGQKRDHHGSKPLPVDYGYIPNTRGHDNMAVDAFVGPNTKSKKVFVVDQYHPKTKKFDEHKVLLGFNSEKHAVDAYRKSYPSGLADKMIGGVTPMSIDTVKKWLSGGKEKTPVKDTIVDKALMVVSKKA